MKTLVAVIGILFFFVSIQGVGATQADVDRELNRYIEIFSGSVFAKKRRAMDTLIWAGFSTPKLYDLIANDLEAVKETQDSQKLEEAAWYAKALAYSGNSKYEPLLEHLRSGQYEDKIAKNAKVGLERLRQYQKWNPILSKDLVSAPEGKLEEKRVENMLNSSDYFLQRMGAKRIYFAHKDNHVLVDLLAARLKAETISISKKDSVKIDAVAWMIKAVAQSGATRYKPLLEDIAREKKNKKVAKYAKKYANYL